MTARDFCFWLQGGAELVGDAPTPQQWDTIKKHLQLAFVHDIDPSMGDEKHQQKLNEIHSPGQFQGYGTNDQVMRC